MQWSWQKWEFFKRKWKFTAFIIQYTFTVCDYWHKCHFLTVISCEDGVSVEQFQPVEELLALIASFTLLGKTELKVALCVTNPQPPGFKFDPVLTKGTSCLQNKLCIVILLLLLRNYLMVDCIVSAILEISWIHTQSFNYLTRHSSANISLGSRPPINQVFLLCTFAPLEPSQTTLPPFADFTSCLPILPLLPLCSVQHPSG